MEIICIAGSNWKGTDCKAEYRSLKIPKDDRASNLFYSSKIIFSVNESSEISFHSEHFIDLGKYKGQSVEDVLARDPGYYGWMMQGDFPQNTKQVLTKLRLKAIGK